MDFSEPALLLNRLMGAIATKRVELIPTMLADDLVATVPGANESGVLDKAATLRWISELASRTGTMRLDLASVQQCTPTAVGAVVTYTGFNAPPTDSSKPASPDRPYWYSLPTIAAANCTDDRSQIQQLFFVTDNRHQPDRAELLGAVNNWYGAYMRQDLDGFLLGLAEDFEAFNYNGYQSSAPATKSTTHAGYKKWMAANDRGGFVLDLVIAHGPWVAVSVQFLTRSRETGQQKMTNEVHMIRLNTQRQLDRAYYYETDLCGYPGTPCSW